MDRHWGECEGTVGKGSGNGGPILYQEQLV